MQTRQIMTQNVITVAPETPVAEAEVERAEEVAVTADA